MATQHKHEHYKSTEKNITSKENHWYTNELSFCSLLSTVTHLCDQLILKVTLRETTAPRRGQIIKDSHFCKAKQGHWANDDLLSQLVIILEKPENYLKDC